MIQAKFSRNVARISKLILLKKNYKFSPSLQKQNVKFEENLRKFKRILNENFQFKTISKSPILTRKVSKIIYFRANTCFRNPKLKSDFSRRVFTSNSALLMNETSLSHRSFRFEIRRFLENKIPNPSCL